MTPEPETTLTEPKGVGTYVAVNGLVLAIFVAVIDAVSLLGSDAFARWVVGVLIAALVLWFAMMVLAMPRHGGPVALAVLKARDRSAAYDRMMQPLLDRTANWLHIRDDPPLRPLRVLRDTLDWRLLDATMLYAVVYPIGLAFLHWVISGSDTRLGDFILFPAAGWPLRAAVFAGLATSFGMVFLSRRAATKALAGGSWWRFGAALVAFVGVSTFSVAVAVAVAGVFAFIVAGPYSVAVAGAFAGAGAFVGAVVGAGAAAGAAAFAVAVAGATAVTFAAAVTVPRLIRQDHPGIAYSGLIAGLALGIFAAATALDWTATDTDTRSMFLFLAILPLLNALFDWLSLAVTLTLIRLGHRRGGLALLCGMADLALALLFLLASGCTMIAVIHWLNTTTGETFVDLGAFLANAGDIGSYWWVYAMVFSTLLPTLAHFLLATISLLSVRPFGLSGPLRRLCAGTGHDPICMATAPLALTVVFALWLLLALAALGTLLGVALAGIDLALDLPMTVGEQFSGAVAWYLGLFPGFADAIHVPPAP